jgi:hypothetical protein
VAVGSRWSSRQPRPGVLSRSPIRRVSPSTAPLAASRRERQSLGVLGEVTHQVVRRRPFAAAAACSRAWKGPTLPTPRGTAEPPHARSTPPRRPEPTVAKNPHPAAPTAASRPRSPSGPAAAAEPNSRTIANACSASNASSGVFTSTLCVMPQSSAVNSCLPLQDGLRKIAGNQSYIRVAHRIADPLSRPKQRLCSVHYSSVKLLFRTPPNIRKDAANPTSFPHGVGPRRTRLAFPRTARPGRRLPRERDD